MKEILELVWFVIWAGLTGCCVYMIGYDNGRYAAIDKARKKQQEQNKEEVK